MKTGARKLALKKSRYSYTLSPDGTHFLYYDDGHFFTYDMATGKSYNITKDVPASFVNEDDDHNVVKPPDSPIGWAKDGQSRSCCPTAGTSGTSPSTAARAST